MRTFAFAMVAIPIGCPEPTAANDLAPTGRLRAAYLGTNPAQAMRDPSTGEIGGPAYELAGDDARIASAPVPEGLASEPGLDTTHWLISASCPRDSYPKN
jgi:polar amino acid transport system substrate-binding protein